MEEEAGFAGVETADPKGDTGGSLGVIGNDAGAPFALLSRYDIRLASAAISLSSNRFSGESLPGSVRLFDFELYKATRLTKVLSSDGLCCFARFERMSVNANCISEVDMASRMRSKRRGLAMGASTRRDRSEWYDRGMSLRCRMCAKRKIRQ